MKSRGLVNAKNFGQVVSSFNHRHHLSSGGTMTTAANRTVSGRRDPDVRVGHAEHDTHTASTMSAQAQARSGGVNGAGHGRGK